MDEKETDLGGRPEPTESPTKDSPDKRPRTQTGEPHSPQAFLVEPSAGAVEVALAPGDATEGKNTQRRFLTQSLIALIFVIVISGLGVTVAGAIFSWKLDVFESLTQVFFSAIIGLLGSATGFYFAAEKSSN